MTHLSPPSEATAALTETLTLLWPDSDSVAVTRSRRGGHDGFRHLVAIPNATSPRLLVPLENRVAASRAMQRFSASLSTGAAVQRLAVAGLLRVGGTCLFPDRFSIADQCGESVADHLGDVLGRDVTFSVGVGTARVNRKPILQVFDDRGDCLAFAKIGTSPTSQKDVRGEAAALGELATIGWQTMEIPRVIHQGEWRGLFVLVIGALDTPARQPRRADAPTAAMAELASAFFGGDLRLIDTDWWRRTVAQAELVPDSSDREKFERAAERLRELAGDRLWRIGAWHGDWTPWNMAWQRDLVQVWDWERFETGVPAGLDLYHYAVNESVAHSGVSAAAIEHGLLACAASHDEHEHRVLAAAYLLAVTARYLPAAHGDGGHLIRRRSAATLAALDRWLP